METIEALATGWDAATPVGDTVLRRFVHAWSDSLIGPVAAMGARVVRTPDYALADAGRPAAYYSGVTLLRPPPVDGWDALLDEIERHFTTAGYGTGDDRTSEPGGRGDVCLWSAWPTPDLRTRGWRLSGHPPLLLRPAGVPLPPGTPELQIRRVTDAAGLADWERVTVTGYPFGDLTPWRPGVLFDPRVLDTPLTMYVGYVDDRPVGAAASWVGQGMHVAAMGVVTPEERGRGYWRALLRRRLADAAGLPSAGLFSDFSRPGAQRHGYLPLMRLTLWEKPRG